MKILNKIAIASIISLTIFMVSCGSESRQKGTPKEKIEQDAEKTKEESIEGHTVTATTKESSKDWSDYLLYLSLGMNVIVIIGLMMKSSFSENEIRNIAKGVYNRLEPRSSIQPANYNHSNLNKKDVEYIASSVVDKRIDVIVDKVIECIRLNELEKESDKQYEVKSTIDISSDNCSILYAGAANRNDNTFFDVRSQPEQGATLYALRVNGNRAEFELYKGAYEKVIKDNNFLECACELQTVGGRTSVSTLSAGIAEKQSNDIWKITKKAIIKFE